MDAGRPQSVSRENSWSNEPSAVVSSQSSDHHTASEMMSSEPETVAKSGPDAKLQIHVDASRPVRSSNVAERKSPDITVDGTCKPLSSDVSKSAEVIERPADVSQLPQTEVLGTHTCTDSNTVQRSHGNEVYTDLVHDDGLVKIPSLDAADSKDDRENSDADSTPRNEPSVHEEDISVHLDEAVSVDNGTKPSSIHAETELHRNEIPAASDVEPTDRQPSPKSAASDAVRSMEENNDLKQPLENSTDDISVSSLSTQSLHDIQSAGNRPSSRPHSASSRHSASGASRAGNGSSRAPAVDGDRSDVVSSRSVSSIDSNRSSVSSKARTVDTDRSSRSNSVRSSGSNKTDIVDRQVSGRAEGVESSGGSRADSVCSNVTSKTFTVDSIGSGKTDSIHSASKTSRQHDADVVLPDSAVNRAGSENHRQQEDVGADTDDDITDLEADQSLHTKPTKKEAGIADEVSAAPHLTPTAGEDGGQEVKIGEDVVNLTDERLPEELDSDSDLNEDVHGSVVRSGVDTGSLLRNASEPQSDTSESRTGRKSDDLHRIISKVAAAVESFTTEGERASTKIRSRDEESLADDRCEKVADGAAQRLLTDAIDQMLTVRNQKITAASNLNTVPAVPLSSAHSDGAKSTASTSSDGQVPVRLLFTEGAEI